MIAVIVPAHNEEEHIGACLAAVNQASRSPLLLGESVALIVVTDACTDLTGVIARRMGATVIEVNERNVGKARAVGAECALAAGARWLAFTDADSVVGCDWLAAQLTLVCDAVCGTVEVHDWGDYGEQMQRHYQLTYTDADGHRHIHGANLGVSASAYCRVGGFQPLSSSEDVALVEALLRSGASVAWSAAPRVVTSSRKTFRAPAGFGATLERIARESDVAVDGPLR